MNSASDTILLRSLQAALRPATWTACLVLKFLWRMAKRSLLHPESVSDTLRIQ